MFTRTLRITVAMALVLAAGATVRAADVDDAKAAAKKLADAPNYSWTNTVVGGRGNQQPVEYKTEKDGYTTFAVVGQDGASTDVVLKGAKGVAKEADGWKNMAELQKAADDAGGFSPELIVLIRIGNFAAPATQAASLLEKATNVKKTDDGFTADLAPAAAKDLLSIKMPVGVTSNFPAMETKDAKGTLKLTVKDGALSKVEVHLTGTRNFNDQDTPVDQTTTAAIKDVGTTKVTVADEAKKKLTEAASQPASAPAAKQ